MDDNGKSGAWIGIGLVAAMCIYVTGNPWFTWLFLIALFTY